MRQPLVDEAELQEFHPTNSLRNPIFKQLTSVQSVTVTLTNVEKEDAQLDMDTLVASVVYLYIQSFAMQVHRTGLLAAVTGRGCD